MLAGPHRCSQNSQHQEPNFDLIIYFNITAHEVEQHNNEKFNAVGILVCSCNIDHIFTTNSQVLSITNEQCIKIFRSNYLIVITWTESSVSWTHIDWLRHLIFRLHSPHWNTWVKHQNWRTKLCILQQNFVLWRKLLNATFRNQRPL
jgi:hypothetical protein